MSAKAPAGLNWVRHSFIEELDCQGGGLRSSVVADGRLYLRGTLPFRANVHAGDTVQGGVAARAGDGEIRVCAYTFRMVCSNGSLGTGEADEDSAIDLPSWKSGPELETEFRETVDRLCRRDVFDKVIDRFRSSAQRPIRHPAEYLVALVQLWRKSDSNLEDDISALDEWECASMDEMITRMDVAPGRAGRGSLAGILARYRREGDRTEYGMLNAITEQARDTDDPQRKWGLEELGGAVLAEGGSPLPTLSGELDEGGALC